MLEKLKQIVKGLMYGLGGGIVGLLLLALILNNSEKYGNVADWVSGIGALGAILAVYWQVKKQAKDSKRSFEQNQEFRYKLSRPLLKMSIENISVTGREEIYNQYDEILYVNTEYWLLKLENLSLKPLIALELSYEDNCNKKETFFVQNVAISSTIFFMLGEKIGPTGDESNLVLKTIQSGTLNYITELGERCSAQFQKKDADNITIFDKKYENICHDNFDEELNFDFKKTSIKQSYIFG